MQYLKRIMFFMVLLITNVTLSGCVNKNKSEGEKISTPNYSYAVIIENNQNENKMYNLDNYHLNEHGTISNNVTDLVYNKQKSVYVYLDNVNEESGGSNKIVIINKGVKTEITDFFLAEDVKLNSSGDKIAYRTFKNNSLDSAQGMKIYDLKNKKYIKLNSKVLVSGNLYNWLDGHRIIYYGSMEGKQNSNNIYVYDFNTSKEQIYLEDTKGYCVYFTPLGNDILFLSRLGDTLYLYYYNYESREFKLISNNFKKIYNSLVDEEDGAVFFSAGIGEEDSELYKFTSNSGELKKITYDFPQNVKTSSNICKDEKGNIYFVGLENEESASDVFMYDVKEKSINIISDHEANYTIYGDVK